MGARPKIAITTRLELATNRFYLGRDYMDAVEANGGVPLLMSLIPNARYVSEFMDGVDGVLLPGSDSDVDPLLYGEQPHRRLGTVIPEKDQTDFLVLAEAEKRNLPVLAICFGMQSLNVSRGGSLVQDIASHVPECIKHEQGSPRDRSSHSIDMVANSHIARLAGDRDQILVNSHHHQSVKEVGENLQIAARAFDGVIECIQDTRKERYVIGVQWHPELSWRTNSFSAAIFEDFVKHCV